MSRQACTRSSASTSHGWKLASAIMASATTRATAAGLSRPIGCIGMKSPRGVVQAARWAAESLAGSTAGTVLPLRVL